MNFHNKFYVTIANIRKDVPKILNRITMLISLNLGIMQFIKYRCGVLPFVVLTLHFYSNWASD